MNEPSRTELPPSGTEQASGTPPSRKRQIDDDDRRPPLKRARLTRENLATFDGMGKSKNPDPTDGSGTIKTRTTSTTTSGFARKARDNGILDPYSSRPPKNVEDIRKRHSKSRATASPPESAYGDYVEAVEQVDRAGNEATLIVETSGMLLKKYKDKGYNLAYNRAFTNLPSNIGFNNGLSVPQPDFVEGLEAEEYRPFPVDQQLPGAALYQDNPHSITLPQISGEWKGPDGNMNQAKLQSAYDGAALVYARNEALSYIGKPDPPGHATITTFTTDGTNLNLYAHYAAPSEEDEDLLEYHQYQYASTNIKGAYQAYKDGRRGLRNAQDHAKARSEALRDQLKKHWKQQRNALRRKAEEAPQPTSDSKPAIAAGAVDEEAQNEDDAEYEMVEQPCQPTPAASTRPRKPSQSHSHSSRLSHRSREGHKRKSSPSQSSSHGSSQHVSKHRSYRKGGGEEAVRDGGRHGEDVAD